MLPAGAECWVSMLIGSRLLGDAVEPKHTDAFEPKHTDAFEPKHTDALEPKHTETTASPRFCFHVKCPQCFGFTGLAPK